ncbi:type II secretion system minor pseudopilin GspK [Aquincola sp. S2]|uniref:Type II secretion system protein K n=1 Tax=Pseudaquabacterium terrae TaxID=2732868 RepID=A0ABX2ECD3_9BURK|nr:type II secretion system minor pseudopilin GspK [Aquabacterium terrae]NRF66585.1 type II secretion system minor pseudopilin GspK [Aquabacterium terrae]
MSRTCRPRSRQRGAALLVAMVLLTLVATLAAGMVWQQWRAVQVEIAERGRAQLAWILNGAIDWARLFLREDARADLQNQNKGEVPTDNLNETWAKPLEEARLSTFLAADKDNNADDGGPEAFLSGSIVDAQARYNLRQLVDAERKVVPGELDVLKQLCAQAGVAADIPERLANGLAAATAGTAADAPLLPVRLEDLAWLGIDAASIERLRPLVWLQPPASGASAIAPVNLNTAPREVLAAVFGVDPGAAERLVQARQQRPLSVDDARRHLNLPLTDAQWQLLAARVGVTSQYFELRGRMRLDDRVLEETALLKREQTNVVLLQRQRQHLVLAPGS